MFVKVHNVTKLHSIVHILVGVGNSKSVDIDRLDIKYEVYIIDEHRYLSKPFTR